MKEISFGSLRTCVAVAAVSIGIALISSTAKAQSEWGNNGSQSADNAKKAPPPPPIEISGTWDGTIQDSKNGPGMLSLTFTEKSNTKKGTLKGTWTTSYPDTAPEGAINDVGTITGSVIGSAVALTLLPRKGDALGDCRLIFNSTEASQASLTGTYRFSVCGESNTGIITLAPGLPPTTVFVNIADDFFFPTRVTITRGQTVRWTNNGGEAHSVTANPGSERCKPASGEAFASPSIGPATTFDHTFNNSGSFAYHCEIHGCMMKGTVIVE
jgi:plastocyanin